MTAGGHDGRVGKLLDLSTALMVVVAVPSPDGSGVQLDGQINLPDAQAAKLLRIYADRLDPPVP